MDKDTYNEFCRWSAHTWAAIAVALAVGGYVVGKTDPELGTWMFLFTGASLAIAHRLWRRQV